MLGRLTLYYERREKDPFRSGGGSGIAVVPGCPSTEVLGGRPCGGSNDASQLTRILRFRGDRGDGSPSDRLLEPTRVVHPATPSAPSAFDGPCLRPAPARPALRPLRPACGRRDGRAWLERLPEVQLSSSVAGATPAAWSASGQAPLRPRGPEHPQARRATALRRRACRARIGAPMHHAGPVHASRVPTYPSHDILSCRTYLLTSAI